jgi:ubiquinone/menaquinone biosynthesis C-methylase UbiE
MAEPQIRFEDGDAYERTMGVWSRLAGEVFLDWLAPRPGLRWIDIGCGSGAFTELIVERCAPAEVQGIDPSEGQLKFARRRPAARVAQFREGDAMALPFPGNGFDAAVMALVIFFVPDPAKGVAEMARVVCPGGVVATYAWDMCGGGFPLESIRVEMQALGLVLPIAPNPEASRVDTLRDLWTSAGLEVIETRTITVQRTFANFENFWTTSLMHASMRTAAAAMAATDVELLKTRVRTGLLGNAAGRTTYTTHANAIKGRVPIQPHTQVLGRRGCLTAGRRRDDSRK